MEELGRTCFGTTPMSLMLKCAYAFCATLDSNLEALAKMSYMPIGPKSARIFFAFRSATFFSFRSLQVKLR